MRARDVAPFLVIVVAAVSPRVSPAAVCTPQLQWSWNGPVQSPALPEACTTPLVLALSDETADLDQDGSPELFVGATVWDRNGRFLWQGQFGTGTDTYYGFISICHAVELVASSPGLELLCGHTAYAADGSVVWNNALSDGWTAVGDLDGDGRPEVVLTTTDTVYVLDNLGVQKGSPYVFPGTWIRQPMMADLDG